MTSPARVAVVVFLVVLAGCSFALDIGQTTSPTSTPGVQQETPNATPTSAPSPYPPGVNETTIENVSALLAAHTEALNGTGYVANGSGNTTIRRSGFLVDVTRDVRVVVANGSERYFEVRRTEAGPVDRHVQRFSNGSVEFRRFQENGNVEFRRRAPQSPEKLARVEHLESFLRGGDFDVTAVNEDDDPTTLVLQADSWDNETALLSGLPADAERIRSYDATATVDSAGRVRWLNASVGFVIGGNNRTHTVAFNLTRIGVSNVSRPDWVDEVTDDGDDGERVEGTPGDADSLQPSGATGAPAGSEPDRLHRSRLRADPPGRLPVVTGHGVASGLR